MKSFIQENFQELLLTAIILCLAGILILSMRWHDDTTAGWARTAILAVIAAITTLINAIKQPKPNGTTTLTTTTDKVKEEIK